MRKYTVEMFLPLTDRRGKRIPAATFARLNASLTDRFGGLTAYVHAPAAGLWKPKTAARRERDVIVVYEVMTATLDAKWWSRFRRALEKQFRQDTVLIRATRVRTL